MPNMKPFKIKYICSGEGYYKIEHLQKHWNTVNFGRTGGYYRCPYCNELISKKHRIPGLKYYHCYCGKYYKLTRHYIIEIEFQRIAEYEFKVATGLINA